MKLFKIRIIFGFAALVQFAYAEYRHSVMSSIESQERWESGGDLRLTQLSNGVRFLSLRLGPRSIDKTAVRELSDGRRQLESQLIMVEGTYSSYPLSGECFIHPLATRRADQKVNGLVFRSVYEAGSAEAIATTERLPLNCDIWLEKLARLSLAKYAADQRIRAGSSQAVNGRSVAGFTAQKSNVNYVRFADWASARGIQYTYDSVKCTISFTRNGKSVLLPIAAQAVRINGTWRDLPDIVMISPDRDERTLVPVALDALTN